VTAAPARGGGGAERTFDVGLVMMATGRKPRTEGLGIEVRLWVVVKRWARLRCSVLCVLRVCS
jgi:pyruvate/2-oxoglutarate dehydrogenase complex dihydrolipoamide dehydrogenase (E3) component